MNLLNLPSNLILKIALIIAAVVGIVLLWVWRVYNLLIHRRNQVLTDLSDINIQIKQKIELVDQLIGMVREYAKHERETFVNVAKARSALKKGGIKDLNQADDILTKALQSIMLVVENYPKLQASENFRQLRSDLKEIEGRIARYREEYNRSVQNYNNALQTFPNLLIAHLLGFHTQPFFQIKKI